MVHEIKITVKEAVCGRCSHRWILKGDTLPKTCPLCRSPYWNRDRVNAIDEGRKAKPRETAVRDD